MQAAQPPCDLHCQTFTLKYAPALLHHRASWLAWSLCPCGRVWIMMWRCSAPAWCVLHLRLHDASVLVSGQLWEKLSKRLLPQLGQKVLFLTLHPLWGHNSSWPAFGCHTLSPSRCVGPRHFHACCLLRCRWQRMRGISQRQQAVSDSLSYVYIELGWLQGII